VAGGRGGEAGGRGMGVSWRPGEGGESLSGDGPVVGGVNCSGRIVRRVERRKGGRDASWARSRGGMENIWIWMMAWACRGSGSTRMVGRVVEIERSNNRRHFERSICRRRQRSIIPDGSSLADHANPTSSV
jgi:hypothetical protein